MASCVMHNEHADLIPIFFISLDQVKPNFLILGAQKCGTSWLHSHLSRHQQVFLPAIKELEFFSYEAHLINPGITGYLKNFAGHGHAKAIGEASPSYFWTATDERWDSRPRGFQKNIPAVVRQCLGPSLRFIVALRDPVERALSAYAHYIAHQELPPELSFDEAKWLAGIIDMGLFARHLENWFEHFPPEQFLVLSLEEDIHRNPAQTLIRVQEFLDLPILAMGPAEINESVFPGTRREIHADGSVTFSAPPHHPDQIVPLEPVTAEDIHELRLIYQADVERLHALTGVDFRHAWG